MRVTMFEPISKIRGIRCSMEHKGLPATATAFGGTLLQHMAEWHPKIYRDTVAMNKANRDKRVS